MPDSVTRWLEQLGLSQYADAFEENAIELDQLPKLSNDDLKELGVNALGHRKRICEAAESIAADCPVSQGQTLPSVPKSSADRDEAERRQLTVMFCDLAGSTELSQQLDPEDLREVNRAYQDACKAAIERYEGYVARYMGDGVLAYFGYPQAHEDDAERSIHAGLSVVESVTSLNVPSGAGQDIELSVRIGISTGPVVVGDLIGEGASQENAVIGETPNVAARLQSIAKVNAVVIAPVTRELVKGRFSFADEGLKNLKGIAAPMRVWTVTGIDEAESRFQSLRGHRLTELVGRSHEIGLLLERWEQAQEGDGQVVLCSGEAGIGKSRIVEALCERTAARQSEQIRYQCSPFHVSSALHPVIAQLERAARFAGDDPTEVKLDKLESLLAESGSDATSTAALLAALLSIPVGERYPSLEMSAETQKEKTLEALVVQVERLSIQRPVLLIFEDVHWSDPTTLELLALIVARIPHKKVMLLITFRLEFASPWAGYTHITSLTLNRLGRGLIATMAQNVTGGKALPAEVLEQITEKTDGVPLFVEELTKTVIESDLVEERADEYVLTGSPASLAIPSTLHDSLMARLDRLQSWSKDVAQAAAAIGREFTRELLAAVTPLDGDALQAALEQLMQAELVFRNPRALLTSYIFKHALVQNVAYESLLKRRRRDLHARIARALAEGFPETAGREPELVAHHYTEAGLSEPACDYWLQAGRRAIERSASQDAVAHLSRGLAVLHSLPPSTERDRTELDYQFPLVSALTNVHGWGSEETVRANARARELCELLGEKKSLAQVLENEAVEHWAAARYRLSAELSQRSARLFAELSGEDTVAGSASALLTHGWPHLALAEFAAVEQVVSEILARYDPEQHSKFKFRYGIDYRVEALAMHGLQQWTCGLPEQALRSGTDALAYARELDHPSSLAWALTFAGAQPAAMRGDVTQAEQCANELIALPKDQRSPVDLAWGKVHAGWAWGKRGQYDDGLPLLLEGLESLAAEGAIMFRALHLALLAELHIQGADLAGASRLLDDALQHIAHTEEHIWESEIHRLKGELCLVDPSATPADAEACFLKAIKLAKDLGAKSLELRAATSLARSWMRQDKPGEARGLLSPIYNWFTEGFDSADLIAARTMLEELT